MLDDGTVKQSSHNFSDADYSHKRIGYPMLGIILNVYPADHPKNRSAFKTQVTEIDANSSQKELRRGNRLEARVLIVNDGQDNTSIIDNVVVTPTGMSGADDFEEAVPRPCSFTLDGSNHNTNFNNVDINKLDGDWCIVGFIGGQWRQPFILCWWPHPGNKKDAVTSGQFGGGLLQQGGRFFKRYRGAKFTITDQGSIFIDTNESGSLFEGTPQGTKRTPKDTGGDLQLDVKHNRKVEINFNPVVPLLSEPSVPQPNPPVGPQKQRDDSHTRLSLQENLVELIAGEVIKLITRTDNIQIIAQKVAQIVGTDGGVELGGTDLSSSDGVVHGSGIDPFSGLSYEFLGNTSSIVRAKKG